MECPISITNLLNYGVLSKKWSELSVLLNETIISLEQLLLSSNLKELSIDVKEDYPFSSDRDAVIERTKLSVISETLNSLKILYNHFERCNGDYMESSRPFVEGDIESNLKRRLEQLIKNCYDTFESLNNNAKSPYDLVAILHADYFKQSLKIHPTNDLHDRARSFIKLVQVELGIIKESSETNEMQKVILTSYLDKLKTLNDQITSSLLVTTTSSSKKNSKFKAHVINKICAIMEKCKRLIKDVYGLIQLSNLKDSPKENHEIFKLINEKCCDAFPDVCKFIEKIKTDWLKRGSENTTLATCRSNALRKLNVNLKLTKNLDSCKNDLESSYIILGLKNIVTDTLRVDVVHKDIYQGAFYLTFNILNVSKPRVDVPTNFIRDDPIYEEIHEKPYDGLIIVYICNK